MNRKDFLSAAGTIAIGSSLPFKGSLIGETDDINVVYRKPPSLKQGDVIGITSPAGFITFEEIQPAKAVIESWGYTILPGATIGKRSFTLGGTDEERLSDLQQMLDDPKIKAIICARGGYGSIRIVDNINWTNFITNPKWLIGFSDITILHNHIHTHCKIASIHSKMTNSFPDDWNKAEPIQIETIISIKDALEGTKMRYTVMPNAKNKTGVADGILIGGNLKTIESLAGSKSDINTDGKILFVEDTGEYLYSIDRMFWNLKRTGKLKSPKGLIIGGFKVKPDDAGEEFGSTVQDIVLEKIKKYTYPVCFDFPVGHQRANFALKCGVQHRLKITAIDVSLNEI
ncbi:MAG: LD-carboxypeptidase [Bacteroidota bacterium]|nr:LD-carboxypeptidase [Bacteroidota bacterium]